MDLDLAAVVVSVVALGATAAQAWFMRLADQRAKRADKRSYDHECRLEAQEKRDQERAQREQRQLELAEAEARASTQARPTTTYLGPGASPGARVHRYRVTNIGQGSATDLKAFLIDAAGGIVSDENPPYVERSGLLMAKNSAVFEIAVRGDAVNRNPLFVRLTWTNEDSQRREHVSNVEVPVD